MIKTVKYALAATLLTAASLPALAQVATPSSGNGGLAFIAYDAVAGRSLYQDLGLTINDLTSTTLSANPFVLSGWDTAFGSSTLSNIRWMVVAGDSDGFGGGPNYTGEQYDSLRLAATSLSSAPVQSNIGLEAGLFNLEDFALLRVNGTCAGANPCIGTSTADANYAGALQDRLNGLAGGAPALNFATIGSVTDTLNFFLFSGTGGSGSTASIRTAFAGLFSLNPLTDTLTFAGNTPPVPLPAAVWLLLSGLVGMFTVSRRRTAEVAA